ncbi:MAG: BspA family leucine-rich repeat surface protein [Saccharospirillaceae bacterium]|nr:BspA family leucine-rich repeat surface protein [Pseudomonadales bacterium]NRB77045.1 BspA family leucine-rich repeat surface protein [Saccharospirillaceae bacterium]
MKQIFTTGLLISSMFYLSACGGKDDESPNDTTPPVVTLNGLAEITLEVHSSYTEQGSGVSDNIDSDLQIVITSDLDVAVVGNYTVIYQATDKSSNVTNITRTVNVVDTQKPELTLNGEAEISLEVHNDFNDKGAMVSDNYDLDLQAVITSDLDIDVLGTYTVNYQGTDSSENTTNIIRTVNVIDTQIPELTLNGESVVTLELHSDYTEEGAAVTDNYDSDIQADIGSDLDISVVGSYSVTYQAVDSSSNTSELITRTVNVVDSILPVITLNGEIEVSVEVYSPYIELGAVVTDNYDLDLQVVTVRDMDVNALGIYTVTYQANDSSLNAAIEVVRTVNVVDTQNPEITLIGGAEFTFEVHGDYFEFGATVSDNYDSDLDVVITSDLNVDEIGSYIITYQTSDNSSNTASITRTINIVDTQIPVLTLNGESDITLEVFDMYTEQGAVVSDNNDLDLQAVITSDLEMDILGNYTITYQFTDAAGNIAQSITRTVNVVDTTDPVLILTLDPEGEAEVTLFDDEVYQELGAVVTDNYDNNLTIQISDNINNQITGSYTVTYQVSDTSGNQTSLTRTVNVVADLPPQLTLNGQTYVSLHKGDIYTELNATAIDDKDGELIVDIVGSVNMQEVGIYQLIYSVTDSNNHTVTVKRWVSVLSTEFITTWKTDNIGVSEDNQIRLEVNSDFAYDYNVDWGDGQTDSNVTAQITHSYAQAGVYTVEITGTYPQSYFAESSSLDSDSRKILSVEQWGNINWLSMFQAFYYAELMEVNASDKPDLSSVTNMNRMFQKASRVNQDINHWDVSSVTDMSEMFSNASGFNQALNNWDVSSVTNMDSMFANASNFNQDLSNWDVSKVTSMNNMFYEAGRFDQNINSWDVSKVEDMSGMFRSASIFNNLLKNWDVSSVKNMQQMFSYANKFNQDISNWDVSKVTDMSEMFVFVKNFDQDLSDWDVSKVTNMFEMFRYASKFNSDISDWNVVSVKNMGSMFYRALDFNQNINGWDVSSVTNMTAMFFKAIDFNQNLSSWVVSSVTTMGGAQEDGMFEGAESFDQDLSLWDISNVTHMGKMFKDVTLSRQNYDALLISWSSQMPQQNVEFDGGNSKYTPNSFAQTARTNLVGTWGWTITDGGAG